MDEEKTNHENDIQLGPLEKSGEKLISCIDNGSMAAILSKNEVMYVFLYRKQYQCFIHPLDAPEGRRKALDINVKSQTMLKKLSTAADQLFEIRFAPDMDFMGVMVAAEKGIINFLDTIGQLPAEDYDFMASMEGGGDGNDI